MHRLGRGEEGERERRGVGIGTEMQGKEWEARGMVGEEGINAFLYFHFGYGIDPRTKPVSHLLALKVHVYMYISAHAYADAYACLEA